MQPLYTVQLGLVLALYRGWGRMLVRYTDPTHPGECERLAMCNRCLQTAALLAQKVSPNGRVGTWPAGGSILGATHAW